MLMYKKQRLLGVFFSITLAVSMMGISAVARGDDNNKPGAASGTPGASRVVTFEELKSRCEHPDQFDTQKAPENIRIQCTDTSREFVFAGEGEIPLPQGRRVITALFSDKFHVNAGETQFPLSTKNGSCLKFKEIEKNLTLEKALTCADLTGIKGSLDEFCVSALDLGKSKNSKLIEVRDTGRVLDTCAGFPQAEHNGNHDKDNDKDNHDKDNHDKDNHDDNHKK